MRLAHTEWKPGLSLCFVESRGWGLEYMSLIREWDLRNKGHQASRAGGLRWECVPRRLLCTAVCQRHICGSYINCLRSFYQGNKKEKDFMWLYYVGQKFASLGLQPPPPHRMGMRLHAVRWCPWKVGWSLCREARAGISDQKPWRQVKLRGCNMLNSSSVLQRVLSPLDLAQNMKALSTDHSLGQALVLLPSHWGKR